MAHYLTSDDKYRGLPYGNESVSHVHDYRFGRAHGKPGRGRSALNRANGYLKNLIEAMANAKLRRMLRELELQGISPRSISEARVDSSNDRHLRME